ncbi:PcoD Putative copper export protein [Caulobacteraceae bacterium]
MDDGGGLFIYLGVASKLALYLIALLAAGIALSVAGGVIAAASARKWLVSAGWLALGAVIIAGLRACLTALELGDIALVSMVWDMQRSSLVALFLGFLTLMACLLTSGMVQRVFLIVGAFLMCTSFALTGHTQALEAPGLFSVLVAGHVIIAAFWLSAPFVLWPRQDQSDEAVQAACARFGAIAIVAVPLLFVGGAILAWKLGGGFGGLTSSSYGLVLGAKSLLASGALGLGAINKTAIARLLKSDALAGRIALKATLRIDALLFCGALVAISLATTTFGPNS